MTEKARYKKLEEEAKEKHRLAIIYVRQHEIEKVPLADLYINAEKPFRVHKKDRKYAHSKAYDWYKNCVFSLLTESDIRDIYGLNLKRYCEGLSESLASVTYIKDEEGKLLGVPDNRNRIEALKILRADMNEEKQNSFGGEGTGANKITIEITGNNLQTAKDVWDDIQD